MAISHRSSSTYNTSIKLLSISTTIICTAIALNFYPDIVISLPSFYHALVSWLKPPYLYLVINCIIITIVATSKLQSRFEHSSSSPPPTLQPIITTTPEKPLFTPPPPHHFDQLLNYSSNTSASRQNHQHFATQLGESGAYMDASYIEDRKVEDFGIFGHVDAKVSETETEFTVDTGIVTKGDMDSRYEISMDRGRGSGVENDIEKRSNEFVIAKTVWATPVSNRDKVVGKEYSGGSVEKPPAATRFGHHQRIVKSSPEGGKKMGLRVSKPKRQNTLESTWKTITEGRGMPLTRHLKKSDTWETHGRHHHKVENELHHMTKSETFSERSETSSPLLRRTHTPVKLKKEPSLGQDDLNKRVEAFIRKFNEDMRLQRQESLNQYMQMVNRGGAPH